MLDVLMGMALLGTIMGLALPSFKLAKDAIHTGGCRDRLERAADSTLAGLLSILRAGRVTSVSSAGEPPAVTVLRVRKGLELSEFSAKTPSIFESEPLTVRFRPVQIVQESDATTDLNHDGDRADSFSMGVLEVEQGGSVRAIVSRPIVLLALPGYAGDLDGNGSGDPMLVLSGETMGVHLHFVDREENGRYVRTAVQATVKLRNQ